MDRQLRQEIRNDVMAAVRDAMAKAEERWISGKELSQQFAMFNAKWLKQYGDCLPRKRVTVIGTNGGKVTTHWAYPQHEIAIGIAEGRYDELRVFKDVV